MLRSAEAQRCLRTGFDPRVIIRAARLDRFSRDYAKDMHANPPRCIDCRERYTNHMLVTGTRSGVEGCDSSEVTNLPLVGQPIG